MKKIYLIFVLFLTLFTTTLNATDYFKWTADGTMKTTDGQSYIVLEYPSLRQEQLSEIILKSSQSIPKSSVNNIQGQQINIAGTQDVIWNNALLGDVIVNIHYIIKIHIKDGKVKIDAPEFTLLEFSTGGSQPDIEAWTKVQKFFKADGTPQKNKQRFHDELNKRFNKIVCATLKDIGTDNDW